jgi:hypothetical protein
MKDKGMLHLQYGINEMPFQKGKSGNPASRKPGNRNRLTEVAESLFDANSLLFSTRERRLTDAGG